MYSCQWNSLVSITDTSRRMISVAYMTLLSAQIQLNAAKLIGRCFTVQMDNDPKQTANQTKCFSGIRNWVCLSGQVSHLISTQLSMLFIYLRQNWKTHKPAVTKGGCNKVLAKHLKCGISVSGNVYECETSGSHWPQRENYKNLVTVQILMDLNTCRLGRWVS